MRIILLGSLNILLGICTSCRSTTETSSYPEDISDIKTITVRADGHFDVTCINDQIEVVGEADVMNDIVCLPKEIESGYYEATDGHTSYCKQLTEPRYEAKVLRSLQITWTGPCSWKTIPFTCAANSCEGLYLGTILKVEPIETNTYRYRGIGGRWGRLKKTGPANQIASSGTVEGDTI